MPHDLDALRRDNPVSSVVGRYVTLIPDGREFKAPCPFHREKTPSFTVSDDKGFAHCFGCGFHGDIFDFVMRAEDIDFPTACERLGSTAAPAKPGKKSAKAIDKPPPEINLSSVDATDDDLPRANEIVRVYNVKRKSWPQFIPSAVYVYRTDVGEIIGAVLRVDTAPGHKITPQIRLACLPDGKITWALWSFDRPRPLYGLEYLDAKGEVWVLEGEKKADRARELGYQAVAWPGGSNGHPHVDWTPLKGRDLLLWPDNDPPGWRCMAGYDDEHGRHRPGVAELAQPRSVRIIPPDPDKPEGWDICDMPREMVADYVAERAASFEIPGARPTATKPAPTQSPQRHSQGSTGPGPSEPSPDAMPPAADVPSDNRDDGPTNSGESDAHEAPETPPARTRAVDEAQESPPDDRADRMPPEAAAEENGDRDHPDAQNDDAGAESMVAPFGRRLNGYRHRTDGQPFDILGHNRGTYFYLPTGTQQVVEITAAQHTQAQLLALAPLDYWEEHYNGANARAKFDVAAAANALMRRAESSGIFVPDMLRGRGAWIDDSRPVMHLGPQVYVEDKAYKPTEVPSKFIYEAAAPLHLSREEPADNKEAHALVDIASMLGWENPLSAQLLAGWCVVAPVCGALSHRPHIWITGSSASGKSTVLNSIIGNVVGPFAVRRDGSTTEAHLRQTLFHDALPIIIDEAEPDEGRANHRMRAVLELSRISSDGGKIGKGGKDGQAIDFTVRACFCFSSINVAIANYADNSRISRLILKKRSEENEKQKKENEEHFKRLNAAIAKYFTPKYAAKMFARSVHYLPVLLANIRVFTDAAATVIGSRRAANQVGALLAGTYLCHSQKEISYDYAVKWIKEKQWGDHTAINAMKDEQTLLMVIAAQRRRVTVAKGPRELTIGELIDIDVSGAEMDGVGPEDARRELGRIGIKTDCRPGKPPMFIIANNSPELSRILEGKPWATDWARPLRALGGEACGTEFFSVGLIQRGTKLDVGMLRG